jgi:hypothetical protein
LHHYAASTAETPLMADPLPNFPRLCALALFGRRSVERAETPCCRRPKTSNEQTSSPSPRHKAPNDADGRTIPCGVAALETSVDARGRAEAGRQSSTPATATDRFNVQDVKRSPQASSGDQPAAALRILWGCCLVHPPRHLAVVWLALGRYSLADLRCCLADAGRSLGWRLVNDGLLVLLLQIDGAILIIWGIVEFNAPAPASGVTSVFGYGTAMKIASPMSEFPTC